MRIQISASLEKVSSDPFLESPLKISPPPATMATTFLSVYWGFILLILEYHMTGNLLCTLCDVRLLCSVYRFWISSVLLHVSVVPSFSFVSNTMLHETHQHKFPCLWMPGSLYSFSVLNKTENKCTCWCFHLIDSQELKSQNFQEPLFSSRDVHILHQSPCSTTCLQLPDDVDPGRWWSCLESLGSCYLHVRPMLSPALAVVAIGGEPADGGVLASFSVSEIKKHQCSRTELTHVCPFYESIFE